MSDREIMNAKGLGKQLELFEDEKLSPKYWQVPFVDEVQEFNETFGKPNNYEPTIPEKKEWMFVYDFIQEELAEYKEACEKGDIVEILDALCDITYVSLDFVLLFAIIFKKRRPVKIIKPINKIIVIILILL